MNCINCGAVLHGNKCEYCGTEYSENGINAKSISNENDNMINGQAYLMLNGEKIDVYVSHEETHKMFSRSGRFPVKKRKFTVIEI